MLVMAKAVIQMHRYRKIFSVLLRHGFGDFVSRVRGNHRNGQPHSPTEIPPPEAAASAECTPAERLRLVFEELGPTYMKLGQILSTRPDLLSAEYITELAKLRDDAPSFDAMEARQIIETELGQPLVKLFACFEDEPIAAASLGQVHRARLFTGEAVIVKVQRPHIRQTINADLDMLRSFAGLAEKYVEGMQIQHPTRVVDEVSRTVAKELDYLAEAAHMERFAKNFADDETVYVPRVYHELSTRRVLTMECIKGIPAADIDLLRLGPYDCDLLARRGADAVMKQIFQHGFFHADPHPGNMFVLENDVICFIDFGMMGRIDDRTRERISDFIWAVLRRDEHRAVQAIYKLSGVDDPLDVNRELERDVAELIDEHLDRPMHQLNFAQLLRQMFEISTLYRVPIPSNIFLMIKSISTVESLARDLSPDFNVAERARPFLKRVQRRRMSVRRFAYQVAESSEEYFHLVHDLPGEIRQIFRQIRGGNVRIEFEHLGVDQLGHTLDRISNRLSFSLVLASMIIGSSLMVVADIPPRWRDIPMIGLAGFVFAGLMGVWLLISILRHGKF